MGPLLRTLACFLALAAGVPAQDDPREATWRAPQKRGEEEASWHAHLPTGFRADRATPLVVWFGEEHPEAIQQLTQRGFVVVATTSTQWSVLFAALPRHCHSEQGGFHAVVRGPLDAMTPLLLEHRSYFQTITSFGDEKPVGLPSLSRLPARRVHTLASEDGAALAEHLGKVHAERLLPGAAGEVAATLDDFHHAAAIGDADRYFAILPPDAVYLGTAGRERWTGEAFRRYARRYFRTGSAWTYLSLARTVDVDPDGEIACFDETFDHPVYGECRGTGVMRKRDGNWILRQYQLSVSVPDQLTSQITARIRAFQDQKPSSTRIVLVPQAEPAASGTELTEEGAQRARQLEQCVRDLPFSTIYASEAPGAQRTVDPLCAARSMTAEPWNEQSGRTLLAKHIGQTVLVCATTDQVASLLRVLRATTPRQPIANDQWFVCTCAPEGTDLLQLRY